MILSIGMIVKNEEKYLEQCLAAMRPLLEQVDSELIIADTGSADRTVEIAKKFTENVFHFEWINDFSAARNSTLEKAKGEWYMFIDADEILQNCDDIIKFFNSGEYKKYASASYVQRSFHNMINGEIDHGNFFDFRVLRLTKKLDDVVFMNPIHEALTPYHDPVKHLDLIADHYGYVFYNNGKVTEEAMKKSKRNMTPLLKIINDLKPGEKPDISVYKEISDCCLLLEDYDNALKYLDLGIRSSDKSHIAITTYFVKKAAVLLSLNRYEEVIDTCNEYAAATKLGGRKALASDCTVYFYHGMANYLSGNYKDAIPKLSAFFDLYKMYSSNELNTNDLLYTTISFSGMKLKTALVYFYECCVRENRYDIAGKYEEPFPDLDCGDQWENLMPYVKLKAEIMKHTSYNGLPGLYKQLGEIGRKQLICMLRWQLFDAGTNECRNIIENLKAVSDNDTKMAEAAAICSNYFLLDNVNADITEKYLKKYQTAFNADILCMMLDKNVDITAYVNGSDFLANECAYAVFSNHNNIDALLEKYDITAVSPSGLERAAEFYKYSMAQAARLGKPVSELLKKYGEIGIKWQNDFKGERASREIDSAISASFIASAFEKKDHDLCSNEIQRFLTAFPEFSPIIKAYRAEIEREINTAHNQNALSEFEQMAIAVKQNIREMLKAGNIVDAESVLSEYELLCPNDNEINIIRAEINALK
ncbi:MAG: glycosyltransferase [Ruminiclostridium sp.]|nr:glycosyltransferase [Ruminiclostridium sp.]